MKELDPLILLDIFREMLGPWQWLLLAVAVVSLSAFLCLIVRERGLVACRVCRSRLAGLLGGVLALALLIEVAAAGFVGAGGPIDWLLYVLVFSAGIVGTIVVVYPLLAWRGEPGA